MLTTGQYDTVMTQRVVSSIVQSLAYRHRRRACCGLLQRFASYASMSEEANMKLVELVWEHPILYDCKVPGYSRKLKTDLVWENIGKELHESGKFICCGKYSDLIT